MQKDPVKIFISYSHKNRQTCERIASVLEKADGFDVWYDKELSPGEVYRKRIAEIIKTADYFIILISEASIRSEWVLDEVEYAKKIHKKILPIWVEKTDLPDDLDMILNRYHSLFWHLRSSDEQFEKSLLSVFEEDTNAEKSQGAALVGFGNEFSEKVNLRMRSLLEQERRDAFSVCYEPENACHLGMAHLFGGPCATDREKARQYFKISEYFGNPDARFYLLEMKLEDQEYQTWDEPDAAFCQPIVKEILSLAEEGSIPAKIYMGNLYWYGKNCCEQDLVKSAEMYEECAKAGNARAQYIMAANYYYGDGVRQDYDLAKMYANLALEQKYLKSWRRWGKFYRDGLAVAQDYEKARACYENGARMGDYNCYNKIGDMLYFGWGFPINDEEAFRYYLEGEKSPENGQKYGLWKAKQALGRCYENGRGVPKDLSAAAEKYLEGYRFGSLECKDAYLRCREQ